MKLEQYFHGLLNFGSNDRFKRAKELARRFPSCDWCPFQEDRLNGGCFKIDDHICNEQLRNFAIFNGSLSTDKIREIVESGQFRCWDKLYQWLDTEIAIAVVSQPDED